MYPSFQKDNIDVENEINSYKDNELFELKSYVKNLEQQIKNFQSENENLINLNNNLQKEKIELNASLELKEITINQQMVLLDNLKKKNENSDLRINELEKINQELNYLYIELNQKDKSENEKNDFDKNKNKIDQIIKFSQQVDSLSIIKSRLEHDNRILVNKINYLQVEHENEINMLKKNHAFEFEKKNKIISNLQDELSLIQNNSILNNNNTLNFKFSQINEEKIMNLEKSLKKNFNESFNLKSLIQNLQTKIKFNEGNIKRKENYIKELKNDLNLSEEKLKFTIEENKTINQENKIEINKINYEKENLLKQNYDLRKAYENFNIGIKDINNLFINKMKNIHNLLYNYRLKIKEFQSQLNNAKEQIQNLTKENEKLKKINYKYDKKRNKSNNINIRYKNFENRNNALNFSNSKNTFDTKNIEFDSFNDNNLYNYNKNSYIKNPSNENNIYNSSLDDPFIVYQQQSLENFKNVLQKVDEDISNNISLIRTSND